MYSIATKYYVVEYKALSFFSIVHIHTETKRLVFFKECGTVLGARCICGVFGYCSGNAVSLYTLLK